MNSGGTARIQILTYSSSTQMPSTVIERFEEARVVCAIGYSRAVNDMAAIIALQTAAMEDVRSALRGLSAPRRDEVPCFASASYSLYRVACTLR